MKPLRILALLFTLGLVAGAVDPVTHEEIVLTERWPTGESVCVDAPLRLTFDRPPKPGARGRLEIVRASDGQVVDTIDVAADYADRYGSHGGLKSQPMWIEGNTATVRPHGGALAYNESYLVRVDAEAIEGFSGVSNGWNFRTKAVLARNPERVVVAADGSGDFCTVQGAVNQIEPHRTRPAEIFIRTGTYRGLVRIQREKPYIRLVGEDRKNTVITGLNNDKLNPGWIQRSVLGVEADDFHLENLTVRNETPWKGSQAEAVVINAERCVLRNADFISLQDTLNLSGRVFVTGCYVEGDVDFVWGYGTACFENCHLHAMHDGWFLQARNPAERAGYVFIDCQLTAAAGVKKLWLARIETTRFPASHVAFIRCKMGPGIQASGWQITGTEAGALRFEEFDTRDLEGKPLDTAQRHPASQQLTPEAAAPLSDPAQVLGGSDGWNPPAFR